jgi:hypothetical protein
MYFCELISIDKGHFMRYTRPEFEPRHDDAPPIKQVVWIELFSCFFCYTNFFHVLLKLRDSTYLTSFFLSKIFTTNP